MSPLNIVNLMLLTKETCLVMEKLAPSQNYIKRKEKKRETLMEVAEKKSNKRSRDGQRERVARIFTKNAS